jgi:toxin ParE1/3/4
MRKIHIQARAKQDLKNIWLYSFKNWGHHQADKYYDELREGMTVIVNNPKIGIARDDIRQGYRQYHINRHMVFYRLTPTRIHVVRVLGDNMDVESHV